MSEKDLKASVVTIKSGGFSLKLVLIIVIAIFLFLLTAGIIARIVTGILCKYYQSLHAVPLEL